MIIRVRAIFTALIISLCASANASAIEAYAVVEDVRGTAAVDRDGHRQEAAPGMLLADGDVVTVERGETGIMVLGSTVHSFTVRPHQPWKVDAAKLRPMASLNILNIANASVTRAGDAAVAMLPLHTRLAEKRLKLTWSPTAVPVPATVTVEDDQGTEVFRAEADGSVVLDEHALPWRPGVTWRWNIRTEAAARTGTFSLLESDVLQGLNGALIAVSEGDAAKVRRLQAAILLSHGLHVDAVGLLSRLLIDAPDDPVAPVWLNAARAEHFTSLP